MSRPGLLVAPLALLLLAGPVGAAVAQQAPNQPPAAAADEATVQAGQAVTVPVLANDTDDGVGRPAGEPPRLEVVGVAGDPRATYSPADVTVTTGAGDSGDVVVDYQVSDGELVSTGRLVVHVTPSTTERAVTLEVDKDLVALRDHTVSGQVSPAAAGAVVKVQRKAGDRWRTETRATTDGAGAWAATWSTDRAGRTKLRAKALLPDGGKVVSRTVERRVRAVAAPSVSGPLAASDVPHSWRAGCPVGPAGLRMVRVNHWGYDGRVDRGALVVRAGEARAVVKVLKAAFAQGFPIRRMRPADHFYAGGRRTPSGSDKAAMRAGNTSAFNCRPVTGNPYRISQHSYGNAVDINTRENPYVTSSRVYPAGSRRYLDRSPYRRGMIVAGGVVHRKFQALGWAWGARWGHPDYQHFSSNGG
jgi:D-alanyl-D-alanine carboxypeptidase-like protein/Big-like domain-containing protein